MGIDDDPLDRQKRISSWDQGPITKSNVLLVGAGALGNEVAKSLCQLGVGKITLVDDDSIVRANLNRCIFFTEEDAAAGRFKAEVIAERARRQYPLTNISYAIRKVEELKEDFYLEFDVAFSCLDNLNARLHLNAQCYGKIPLIDGGTTGFLGKVQVVKSPSSCIECSMSKKDYDLLWQKYSCVGEVLDFIDPKMPALSTTNSIIAAIQVNEFIKLRLDSLKSENNLIGKYLLYEGRRNTQLIFDVPKRGKCPVHSV
ncbi:MAG TPA: ThiF family adenylyltransferase [Candidatus Norongarragalinales archaeon]|nr:ThiF family adenylyltransferase [Candidatus Norongarragalinales archaeon]